MSDVCQCGGAQRIAELESRIQQMTEDSRTAEPCGHMKNFLIGDEHGHFTCTVCRIAELERELKRKTVEIEVRRDWMHEDGFCRAVEMRREIELRLQAAPQ